jgi:hypothetical protein
MQHKRVLQQTQDPGRGGGGLVGGGGVGDRGEYSVSGWVWLGGKGGREGEGGLVKVKMQVVQQARDLPDGRKGWGGGG